jgi:hypothetical protein
MPAAALFIKLICMIDLEGDIMDMDQQPGAQRLDMPADFFMCNAPGSMPVHMFTISSTELIERLTRLQVEDQSVPVYPSNDDTQPYGPAVPQEEMYTVRTPGLGLHYCRF